MHANIHSSVGTACFACGLKCHTPRFFNADQRIVKSHSTQTPDERVEAVVFLSDTSY